MSSKSYEKTCARLVQDALTVSYMTALRWVKEHQAAHPATMTKEARALAIVNDHCVDDQPLAAVRCGAFNQKLEVCLRPATKRCTDHKGMVWYACDIPKHDTKTGSRDVRIERLSESESTS